MSSYKREPLEINQQRLKDLVAEAVSAIENRHKSVVFACANPHSLSVAADNPIFHTALNNANQLVVDGVALALVCRLRGWRVPRITGGDYFDALMSALPKNNSRVFFLGSTQIVLDRIVERLAHDYPELTRCAVYSPPFGEWPEEDNEKIISNINAVQPDVLWVGMTAPRQETWVEANRNKLSVPVIGSIGAVFDFYAGTHPRAPKWMRRIGLEWFYRLMREPGRMWRRTIISGPKFVLGIMTGKILLTKAS